MAFKLVGHAGTHVDPYTGRRRQLEPQTYDIGRAKLYPTALRKAVKEILSLSSSRVEIFDGKRLVACGLVRERVRGRGEKFVARCSGEKPTKATRERATRALKAARERARR